MPNKRRGNWAGRSFAQDVGRRRSRGWQRRRAGFEILEDRRLLATLTVNTLIDVNANDGLTTLREAVAAAASNDTIMFSVTGTINLTTVGTGHIEVSKNLTIQGPGANLLSIKAFDPDPSGTNDSDGHRVFYISNGSSSLLNVTISGLTLTNGDPDLSDEENSVGGGAIHNEENLSIIGCVLTGNFAPGGGAIFNTSGALSITDSVITGNSGQDGGGIMIDGGSLSITGTTISNNQASNAGGGILNRSRTIALTNSSVSGNTSVEQGGGIYQYQGTLTVNSSTISGNHADLDDDQSGRGGGIFNSAGGLTVLNSTVSGNTSGEDGGGIFSDTSQTIAINHSTVFGNSVTDHSGNDGGGIRSIDAATLNHTIVAGNLKGSARDDVSGIFDASFSLVGDRRSTTVNNLGGSVIGTPGSPINALLGPLANNAGPTMTHTLLVGSPAIDAGNMSAVAGADGIPQSDQRGMPYSRVANGDGASSARIDMGAVEILPPVPALPGDYNRNNVVDAADYVLWRKTHGSGVPQYSGADGNGNSMVDPGDYDVWRAHFGAVFMPPASATAAAASSLPVTQSELRSTEGSESSSQVPAASVESKFGNRSAMGAAFRKDTPDPASAGAVDLLLALEPSGSPTDANVENWPSQGDKDEQDAAKEFDAALTGAYGELAASVGVRSDVL